jgi:hypothetical protein
MEERVYALKDIEDFVGVSRPLCVCDGGSL